MTDFAPFLYLFVSFFVFLKIVSTILGMVNL